MINYQVMIQSAAGAGAVVSKEIDTLAAEVKTTKVLLAAVCVDMMYRELVIDSV
jgi:hypothetical protein